ncbi:hypothetical protein QL285_077989 [Trifolium repens]|nr:hypothetical protein QL285_077989 [Trifolium repens]
MEKNKSVGRRRRTQKIYTGSPSNLRVHPVPSLLEGFHYNLYKVKQENNPLFFTLLLPTILDSKVIPLQSETREQSSLFHSLASNNPGQQDVYNNLNFVQEFGYKFEYKRILINKVLDFVFSFNITIHKYNTLSAHETLTLI